MKFPFFELPSIWTGRWREDHTGTADGGKPSRLDRMFDDDGPVDGIVMQAKNERLRARKNFTVTAATRFGGSGLYRSTGSGKKE